MLASVEYLDRMERRIDRWLPPPNSFRLGELILTDFVDQVNPTYHWYPHVQKLAAVLERVASGDIKRLMVFMPPRHGKSELVCRLFAAYYLLRHPERWVSVCSYGANLANTFSRNARENYKRAGGATKRDADAITLWETEESGGMWSAGVGGPATGKGFHLGIIDDPVKNAEEASSLIIQERNADWYDSVFYTRQEPDAAIILIMTRWNESDLAGHLLEKESDEPEAWHIVHFEAIKEEGAPEYPPTCTLEQDDRATGEALAPERFSLALLKRYTRRLGSYFWNALYQQRPRPREGGMFKLHWFDIVAGLPGGERSFCRYWDKAGTKDAGAYTAGLLVALIDGVVYVVDLIVGQWSSGEREQVIRQTAELDREAYGHVYIVVEQEPGSGGKESAENTVRNLVGFPAFADRPTGDKVLRAEPVAAQAEIRNVKLIKGPWNKRFLDILTAFPTGSIKDPVDALSGGFNVLVDPPVPEGLVVHDEPVNISPY